MLNITDRREDNALTLALEGRLDTTTAPELETVLNEQLGDATELVFDMKDVGVSETIMEIFEITGFCDILTFA